MTKKLLSLLTICVMMISAFAPSVSAASKNFTDVKQDAWYYGAVNSVVDKGIFAGTSNDMFSPQEPMTRAMFVQVLANFTGNYTAPDEDEIARFTDVSSTAWYYNAVQWAAKNGIASGRGNGKYAPNDSITRQEMVTMLFNYALKTGEITSCEGSSFDLYDDDQNVAVWANNAVRWALANKIIVGVGNNTIEPGTTATRAQVAAMFDNAYGKLASRTTNSTGTANPSDPDKDYLNAMYMTFDELTGGTDMNPSKVTDDETTKESAYTGFTAYPEITAHFKGIKATGTQVPSYLSVSLDDIFPELVGKTAGEIYKALGHTVTLESQVGNKDPMYIRYETENFYFRFTLHYEKLTAVSGTTVYITYRSNPYPVEISKDATIAFDYDGQIMFTIDLPESYKNCIVKRSQTYRDESGMHQGGELYFFEPVSTLRQYDTGENLFLYIFFSEYDGSTQNSSDMTLVMSRRFELNGKTYQLSVMSDDVITNHSDPDVLASYKALWADIDKLVEGIKINSEANIIKT